MVERLRFLLVKLQALASITSKRIITKGIIGNSKWEWYLSRFEQKRVGHKRSFRPGCITKLRIIGHLNEPVSWGCKDWCTREKRPAELLELAETDYGRMNDAYRLDFAGWQTSCSLKCEHFKELFERSIVAMSDESALLSWAPRKPGNEV